MGMNITREKRPDRVICTHYHTKQPTGYVEWIAWADKKSKTHHQIRCPVCGLFSIWVKDITVINPKHIYLKLCERCGGNHKTKDCVKSEIPNLIKALLEIQKEVK